MGNHFTAAGLDFGGGTSKLAASGPHAAICTDTDNGNDLNPTSLLYSTPPYALQSIDCAPQH